MAAELVEEDEPTQSAKAPESEGSLLVVATTEAQPLSQCILQTQLLTILISPSLFSSIVYIFFSSSSSSSSCVRLGEREGERTSQCMEGWVANIYVWVLCVVGL